MQTSPSSPAPPGIDLPVPRITFSLLMASIVAALTGLLFGFDTGVMIIAQVVVVWLFFPETKRVTLEEMGAKIER